MKINKLLLSTWRLIMSHKGMFLLSTVLITLAFMVVEYQAIFLGGSVYQGYMVHQMVAAPERTYLLDFSKYIFSLQEDADKLARFEQELKGMEGIQSAGICVNTFAGEGNEISPIYLSSDLITACHLRNEEGEEIHFQEAMAERSLGRNRHQQSEKRYSMLVGAALKEMFPKGTLYTDELSGIQYVVTDILEPGSKWIKGRMGTMEIYQDLDRSMIFDGDGLLEQANPLFLSGGDAFYLVLEENADREQVKQAVMQLADDCGLTLYNMKSIQETLNNNFRELFDEPLWIYMPIAVLFMALIAIMVSSTISVYLRKSSIGILYALGYSAKDVQRMVILENALKVFLAFMVACSFWRVNEMSFLQGISIIQFIMPGLVLGALAMVLLGSLVPVGVLRRMTPVELIGGRES